MDLDATALEYSGSDWLKLDEESKESGNNKHAMELEKDQVSKESVNDQHAMKMAEFALHANQLAAGT